MNTTDTVVSSMLTSALHDAEGYTRHMREWHEQIAKVDSNSRLLCAKLERDIEPAERVDAARQILSLQMTREVLVKKARDFAREHGQLQYFQR